LLTATMTSKYFSGVPWDQGCRSYVDLWLLSLCPYPPARNPISPPAHASQTQARSLHLPSSISPPPLSRSLRTRETSRHPPSPTADAPRPSFVLSLHHTAPASRARTPAPGTGSPPPSLATALSPGPRTSHGTDAQLPLGSETPGCSDD